MRKVCIVVNSRANYGRIKSVLRSVQEHPDLKLQLVVGASALLYRFGSTVEVMEADGFVPDATCHMVIEGDTPTTMAKSTGLGIIELASLFERLKPDIVLTVADRYETMATAIAASYMNICLAHTQGGEFTGSIDESVRHAITKMAHLHFPSNEAAAKILRQMGEAESSIFVTGCPSIDLAAELRRGEGKNLFEAYGGTGARLDWDAPFLVVLQHPVTTEYGQGKKQIEATIEAVRCIGMQTVWLWPNVDAGSDDISKTLRMFQSHNPNLPVHFYRNFRPDDYVRLIDRAACLVGNSSSGIREGAYLGVPVVNIGTRQSGRERGGNVIDVGHHAEEIQSAIRRQLAHGKHPSDHIYGDGKAGHRIANILATCRLSMNKEFVRA